MASPSRISAPSANPAMNQTSSASAAFRKQSGRSDGAVRRASPGWRNFLVAMAALQIAFGLAIYSGAAAQTGAQWTAVVAAVIALGLAGWVALTIVPALARRTPLRWLGYQVSYRVTREGMVYLAGILVVTAAALNTGNNLLFLIL